MGKYYEKEGVKMALELYEELNLPDANTKDITKSVYAELEEAVKHGGLSDLQYAVIHHRYLKKNPLYTPENTAEIVGIARNKVSQYTEAAVDRIHAYMNGDAV